MIGPCKIFSVFLVRVRHETLCGRAEKTNKIPVINTASFYTMLCSMVSRGIQKRESEWETFLEEMRVCPLRQGCCLSVWKTSCKRRTGHSPWATRGPSETFAPLLLQFSNAVEGCRTKHRTEDLSKTCMLSGKRMDNSLSELTKLTSFTFFSLLFFFTENCASLQILVRWKCCSTTYVLSGGKP